MWPGKPLLAFVVVVGFLAGPARAEDLGARALGRGGVGRADGLDPAGEELNLAALSLTQQYVVFAGGELGPDSRFLGRSGAVDSRTSSVVSLGAGYRYFVDNVPPTGADLPGWKPAGTDLTNPATHQRVHLGLAVPFLERRVSIAAHTRFDWEETALGGPDYAFNFGFSAAGKPIEQLTLALGARNLLTTGYRDVRRELDFGVRFDPGPYLGIEADIVAPIEGAIDVADFAWRAGVDVSATSWLALRGGWSMDAGAHAAHAGLALVSEKATLDYGVKVRLDDPARNWHAVDLRVSF